MAEFKIGQYIIETEKYYNALIQTGVTDNESLSKLDSNNDKKLTEDELTEVDSKAINENEKTESSSSSENNNNQNNTQQKNIKDAQAQQLEMYNNQLRSLEEQRKKMYNSIGTAGDAESVSTQLSVINDITSQIKNLRTQILNYMINCENGANMQNGAIGTQTAGISTNAVSVGGNRNYSYNFTESLSENQKADLETFKSIYASNIDKYKQVEAATGVPAELVAAIHWSESGCDFTTYLHNGDPLGEPTTHVPEGIYFGADQWAEAAIDAIKSQDTSISNPNDITTLYEYAERYNGLGYRNKGLASPYVWAGTTNYTGGKYVADGEFDPNAFDDTLGVAIMLKAIC